MPAVKVGDINISYEVHGKGDPLVLIPGHASDSQTCYFRQIPGLAKYYRVIAIDNRGSGLSDKPDMPYTMDMMAKDAAGLLEAIGVRRAHVYGIFMGGMIAQHLALCHPQMTASLILASTTSTTGQHSVPPDQAVLASFFDTQGTPEERTRKLVPLIFTQKFAREEPSVVEQFVTLDLKHYPPSFVVARHGEAVMLHDVYDRLPQVQVPALVIGAGEDRLIPPENSRILASRIPGAEFIMLDRVGHALSVEAPEAANKAIHDFLKRHPISA